MLTILGNNFGGNYSGVTLKSLGDRFFNVVNGSIDVVASGAAYESAEVLELTVSGLTLSASAPVAVYATMEVSYQKYITVTKAWVKDAQTICIEKVAGWAARPGYRLTFQCVFFPLGYDICPQGKGRTKVSLQNPPSGVALGWESCLFLDDWAFVYLSFGSFNLIDPYTAVSLTLNNVPAGANGNLFLVYNDGTLANRGSGYVPMTLNGTSLVTDEPPGSYFEETTDQKFIKGAIIYD